MIMCVSGFRLGGGMDLNREARGRGGVEGRTHLLPALSHLTIDRASLSRRARGGGVHGVSSLLLASACSPTGRRSPTYII